MNAQVVKLVKAGPLGITMVLLVCRLHNNTKCANHPFEWDQRESQ